VSRKRLAIALLKSLAEFVIGLRLGQNPLPSVRTFFFVSEIAQFLRKLAVVFHFLLGIGHAATFGKTQPATRSSELLAAVALEIRAFQIRSSG
jgi:hypothetical protein